LCFQAHSPRDDTPTMALNSQPILRKGGGKGSDPTAGRDDRRERAAWLDAWEWSGKWIKGKEKDGGKGYDPGKGKEKDGKGKDKGKGKGKEKDGKAKDKDRGWPLFVLYKRCDGWCERVSPPLDVSGPATKSRIYVSLSILVPTCAQSALVEKSPS
jgi:hypothetical protein